MAYLGAIDLIVNKTVSILTVKRLPASSLNTPDVNSTVTQVQALSITFNNRVVKYDNLTGGLTSVRTVPRVQTYYNTTFNNVSVTNVIDTVVSGTSGITTGRYSIITVGGPLVTWNTNPGDLGTFLTNSVVSFNISASTNTGGTLSYTVTVGTLPTNLSLNPSTGAITGVINNTVTVNTTYSFTITATESIAGAYANQGFTITESVRDPYFNYVTLLLNGESPSNNSRNLNTFFQDSSNGSLPLYPTPINRGNVTQGSFGPFNTVNTNGWSGFFNRSASDGLIISGNTVFNFLGASDFTCEAWIFMNSLPVAGDTWPTNYSNNFVVMECGSPSLGDGFSCIIGNTKIFVQSNDVQYGTVNHGMVINTWYHVAWVRYNGTIYFYINGTQYGSVAFPVNVGTGSGTYIGCETGQGAYFDGYISNIRVIQNQALYTGAFTPATAPLTRTTVGTSGANVAASITGTVSLLMLQNNRFLDNSINNNTISVTTGAPKCFPFSAFAPSKYFTLDNSIGVSAYFSGTVGDYLVLPNYGTGSSASYDAIINWYQPRYYSIECWINPTGYAVTAQSPVLIGNMDPVAGTNYWSFGLFSGGVLRFKYYNGVEVTFSTTTSVPIGTWSHIAFVKVGLNMLLYINGVISASAIISGTPQWNAATQLTIGQNNGSAWGGYVYNLRINSSLFSTSNPFNSAIYPAVAALPSATLGSAPALAGSGVQLLTAQSATFVDNSPNSYAMNNGIAPFSGTYSYLFNGSNQFINYSNPAALAFGTNAAFTIEFWLYVTNWSTNPIILDWRPSATQGVYITIYSNTSGQIRFYTSSADRITTSITIPTHTWAHVALVRSAAVTKLYINGIADSITYADTNSYLVGTNRPIVGNGNAATYFPGALSNLRIATVAVYTGNFTPPTSALPLTQSAGAAGTNIAAITTGQTVLLTAQATTITDATGLSITNSANPVVESGSLVLANGSIPFANTYSAVLTGTKLASVNYSTNYNLIDDFTIEFWVNYSSHGSGGGLISFGNAWQITWSAATNALKFEGNNAAVTLTTTTTLTVGLWYHVALTRSGTYMRFYINGTQDATTTTSTVAFTAVGTGSTPSIVIGADKTLSLFTTGYMSNVRFMNRKAYYLQNFAIPTTAFTNPTNLNGVQVLTAQSSTVTDNSATNIVIQSTGFTVTNNAIPFANTYSCMFNGDNSNVIIPATAPGITAFDLTGDFTIEMWFNSNVIGQNAWDNTTVTSGMLINRGGVIANQYASYLLYISNGQLIFSGSSANTSNDIGSSVSTLIGLINSGVWYHVAITRSGNQYRGFLNGIQTWYLYSSLTPYTVGANRGLAIGSNYQTTWGTPSSITQSFSGYISNLRIVKGNALYVSNFTPSTTPLTAVSGTSLLTLQSATLIDNSTYNQPLTASGYSFSSSIIPFSSGTISTGFSNNTNFTGNLPVAINTSNFSLDFWSNPQSFNNSTNPGIFDTRASASDTLGFGVYLSTTNVVLRIGATANNIFTTSGSILPFANTYSWSFTGSTQFITAPSTTEFAFGSGVNFTVEAWVYPFAYGGTTVGASIVGTTNGAASGWSLNLGQDINTFRLISNASGTWADNIIAGTGNGPSLNTWTHVALVRNGATISLYKNGVSVGTPVSAGSTYNFTSPSNLVNIGYFSDGANVRYFNGYMSNVRIVRSAVYTGAFTPPTTAFTNTIQTIPYIPATTYYGTFNGSSQYLSLPQTVGALTTGTFTIEAWIFPTSFGNSPFIVADAFWYNGYNGGWYVNLGTNGGLAFSASNAVWNTYPGIMSSTATVALNVWSHIAVVRDSNNYINMYINGLSAGTPVSYSASLNQSTGNTGSPYLTRVGCQIADNTFYNGFTGNISNVRIVNGTAVYTGNFTPIGPLAITQIAGAGGSNIAAITTGTQTLLLQTASPTTDGVVANTVTNNGTVVSYLAYYGGSTLLTLQSATLIDNSSNVFTLTNSASPVTLNVAASFYGTFTWNHIALVKNSGQIYCYLNGVLKSIVTDTSTFSNTKFYVGSTFDPYYFLGYINNLRLVTGVPLIGNSLLPNSIPFTPSTAVLTTTSQGVTASTVSLLTAQNATIVDNGTGNAGAGFTLTNSASAVTATNAYIPFASTYSYYFNGTTQYLTAPTGAAFQFPGDFTIECWVYSISGLGQASYSGIFDTRTTNVGSATAISLNLSPTGYVNFYVNSVNYVSTVLLGASVWTHVALVRSGTIMTLFQNGIPVASAYNITFNLSNGNCWIGALAGAPVTSFWAGYISNLRVVKGSAVYTVPTPSFTPATSNTSVSNSTVQLLTAQSAAIVDNSINTFALTNANTVLSGNTVIPFSGTYSYQFNGTNYLTATSTTSFNMLTYDFTIEAWVNLSSYNFDLPAILLTAQSPIVYDNSPYRSTITNNNNVGLSTTYPTLFTTPSYSYSFNGSNQSLYVAANSAFAFGYSDFTIEAWVYFNALATITPIVQNDAVGTSTTDKWYFGYTASTLVFANHGALSVKIAIPWTPSLSTWYHVAVVRYNGNFLAFVNGAQGTSTITGTPSTYVFGQNGFSIGAMSTPYYTNGFISNLRIINGRALYTGSFTPSTVPLTALATGTGSAIVGTTNGAQTGYSLWISPDASTIYFSSNATGYWVHNISATAGQLILNTWYHIAVTRQGSTINIWRNGISIASAATFTFTTFKSPNNALYIGYFNDGAITRNFNGYISNLRITQGLALYSATFGPQLSQFTINSNSNIPSYIANSFYNPPTAGTNNTLLLLAQTNSYLDNSSYAVPLLMSNATAPITNSVIPYSNTYSFDFLGTNANSYLSVPPNSNFDLYYQGSTIEFWMYPRFFNASDGTIISAGNQAQGSSWRLTGNVSGALSFIGTGTVTFTTANNAINFNTWNHIAITRFYYTYSIWVNGVNKASGWSTANPSTVGKYLYIGYGYSYVSASVASRYQSFLISNVRVVSGNNTNLYTKAFSPPTSNLTAIPNTIFLMGNTQGFGISASEGYAPSIAANNYACAMPVSNITPFANTYSWSFNSNSTITWAPGFAFGTNPFTIELWFYNTSNAWTNVGLVGCNAANTASLFVHLVSQTQITLGRYGVGNLYFNVPTMLQNTWYHLAVVRDGNNFNTMFLNGVKTISGAVLDSYNYTGITNTLGGLNTINAFAGLISNVRIVYGQDSALYDVAAAYVTIPTVPLTAVPNTQLLTLQDNSPIDNSANNYFVTNQASGPMISKFTPFANTYSVHFSASGNYNYLATVTNSLTQFEARDFTIETWCYFFNSTSTGNGGIYSNYTTWGTDSVLLGKHSSYSGYVCFFIYNYSGNPLLQETTYPPNKTWIHYAVTRIGSTFTMYRNGVATVTATSAGSSWNGIASSKMDPVYIGIVGDVLNSTSWNFYGYLSNYRVVNGLGVYTGNFTPPTTPLQKTQSSGTNIAAISAGQTVLLTCQSDNFIDNSASNLFMFTQPSSFVSSTSVVPFPGAYSIATFQLNSAWLISTTYTGTQLSLSGFPLTVECWFYVILSTGANQTLITTSNWFMQVGSSVNTFIWGISLTTLTIPYNFNLGTWYHAAWTYDTVTHRIYINGLLVGAYNSSAAWTEGTQVWIGSGSGNTFLYGYISNIRIVKGSVVYGIPSFTPATTALTNSVNSTMLLTAQTATFVDNSIMNWYIANVGAGLVTTTNSITPFSTYSYVFNGVNNMLSITTASSNSLELQDDFTIELWFNSNVIYGTTSATSSILLNKNGGVNIAWASYIITLYGNNIYFAASSNNNGYDIGGCPYDWPNAISIGGVGLLGTFSINTWYHVAVVRYNGVYKGYLNGTNTWTQGGMNPYSNNIRGLTIGGTYGGPFLYTNYNPSSNVLTNAPIWGGNNNNTTINTYGFFNGYISNVRINNGAAIYTANFTPASSALTASTTNNYTALLTAQSSTPIDNSPITKYILGGPTYTTNTLIPFANTYSYSLLGTVDYRAISGYMTIASQGPFSLTANTTAFTIEMWVYPIIMPTGSTLFTEGWTGSNYINMTIGFASYGVSTDLGAGASTGSYIAMGFYTGSGWVMTPANTMLELFKWTHIAAVYDGVSTASLFLNGVLNGTVNTTWHTAFNDTVSYIGRRWDLYSDNNNGFQGFISNFRYVKGQALYTYNFTPPTSAVTAIPTTIMLLNFDNASIYDASAKNALTTYGNPTISTGAAKYGTGSIRFNRTDPGSYLMIPATNYLYFSSDFTIECWAYLTSMPASNVYPDAYWIFGTGAAATAAGTDLYIGSTLLNFNLTTTASPELSVAHGMTTNTWYHVAICRSGANLRAYINGIFKQSAGITYSGLFNGTSQYLSLPATTNWVMTNDFTQECWLYFSSFATSPTVFDQYLAATAGAGNFQWSYNTSGILRLYYDGSTFWTDTKTLSINTWYHVAVVRRGSTITIYTNGIPGFVGAFSGTIGQNATMWLGAQHSGGPLYFMNGYVSNARIVKGQAVYGTVFPATSALTTTSQNATATQVSILTAQSATLVDNSTYGNIVSNFYPSGFTSNSSYSVKFTTSTALSIATNAAFNLGAGSWTIECWVYPTVVGGATVKRIFSAENATQCITFREDVSNVLHAYFRFGSATLVYITGSAGLTLNVWQHIALVRNGTAFTLYKDGTSIGSMTNSGSIDISGGIGINISNWTPEGFPGFISNVRLVKGTAIYTSAFNGAVPTAPLTSVSGSGYSTILLCCQSPSTNTDNSGNGNTLSSGSPGTVVIPPTIGNSVIPFLNTYSYQFDGTATFLNIPASTNWVLSADFTIELWVYLTSYGNPGVALADQYFAATTGVGNWQIWVNTSGLSYFYYDGSSNISGSTLSLNTWYNITATRTGTTIRFFTNGTIVNTATFAGTVGQNNTLWIGAQHINGPLYTPTGYISNIRIVKGTALYPGNFTVPIAILQATQSAGININAVTGTQTSMLILQSSSITVDNSTFSSTNIITNNGTATTSTSITPFPSATSLSSSGYNVVIGRSDIAGSANTSGGFNGYIDDLRITKYARYTSTASPAFTPPTGPLPIG